MIRKHNIFLSSLLLMGLFLTSCSCSNDNQDSQDIDASTAYVEKYNDNRVIFTFHPDDNSYSVKMKTSDKSSKDNIAIPSYYMQKPVTEIEDNAFEGYEYVSEIEIPPTVTRIGKDSLKGCHRILKLSLPFIGETYSTNTYIGYYFGEDNYSSYALLPSYLETISITNSDTIPSGAFYGLESLKNLSIPSSLSKIGKDAFYECNSLVTNESEGCLYIGNKLDKYVGLIGISSGTKNIYTTKECKVINLEDDLNLVEKISINDNVVSLNIDSTNGWASLYEIAVSSNNSIYDSRKNCNAIIEKSTDKVILACKNTILRDGIKSISSKAYQGKLVDNNEKYSLTIPDTVTSIEKGAFEGCTRLKSISLSHSMDEIQEDTFKNCSSLSIVRIPKNIKEIGINAFENCPSIELLYFGCSEEEYNSNYITMEKSLKNRWSLIYKTFNW